MELIRMPQVIKMTGMSKSAIYAQIKEGAFPRPLKISQRHVAWDKQHVIDWIQSLPLAKGPTWVDNTTQI
ncbi:AlpA family transcriptional regulator [Pararhodobacter sp. CCB-MM2]|uniref:helix-turn-helix transcriptional regulator n=1 Tax=Pararhodobacter sp. CCB-MM2 TaxID=1786003 RepID=UPI00082E6B1B|nr:AlpA family phage regulatory protein [Pararhodobacter sp. CCB-MM2]